MTSLSLFVPSNVVGRESCARHVPRFQLNMMVKVIANVVSVGIPCMAHAAVFAKHDGDATDDVAVRMMKEIDVFMTLGGGNQDCIISYINDAVLRRM
ncbi:hypothetical protein Tco_0009226 [Tanacetum coccineum]